MGMSLKKFYIFSLINLSMTMVVIICYYENVERKYIFIAFFILSIISNILTITIMTCLKIVEYRKLEITDQVSHENCQIFILLLVNISLTLVTLFYSIINIWNTWAKKGNHKMFLIVGVIVVVVLELVLIGLFDESYWISPDQGWHGTVPTRISKHVLI